MARAEVGAGLDVAAQLNIANGCSFLRPLSRASVSAGLRECLVAEIRTRKIMGWDLCDRAVLLLTP